MDIILVNVHLLFGMIGLKLVRSNSNEKIRMTVIALVDAYSENTRSSPVNLLTIPVQRSLYSNKI